MSTPAKRATNKARGPTALERSNQKLKEKVRYPNIATLFSSYSADSVVLPVLLPVLDPPTTATATTTPATSTPSIYHYNTTVIDLTEEPDIIEQPHFALPLPEKRPRQHDHLVQQHLPPTKKSKKRAINMKQLAWTMKQ